MTKLARQVVKAQKPSIRSKKAAKARASLYSGLDIIQIPVINSDADVSKFSVYRIKRLVGDLKKALTTKARMEKWMSDNTDKVNKIKIKNKNEFLEERLEAIWTPHMTAESSELTKSIAKNMKANLEKHKDYYASLKTNPRKP